MPRTIFDLAAVERPEAVESASRQAEFRQLHDRLSLRDLLDRYPRRRGARVVELDGRAAHGTRFAFIDDRARDRRLRVAGYGVIHLAWSQLDDEPEAISQDLKRILYKRS